MIADDNNHAEQSTEPKPVAPPTEPDISDGDEQPESPEGPEGPSEGPRPPAEAPSTPPPADDRPNPDGAPVPSERPSAPIGTEYFAVRRVRILGHEYGAGDPISDPNIPARVLATLTNTGRIRQRIVGGSETAARASAGARSAGPGTGKPATGRAAGGQPPAASAPKPRVAAADAWRKRWERDVRTGAVPEGTTLRQFLQAHSEARQLSSSGSVKNLIDRLGRAGHKPSAD